MALLRQSSRKLLKFLCLPSPCCQAKLGVSLQQHGLHVEEFGYNVLSASNIPGDHCRTHHDSIKMVLTSNIRAECEDYGEFCELITVEALALGDDELQQGRARRGLLPEFNLELPTPEGDHVIKLAELKVIGAVDTVLEDPGWGGEESNQTARREYRRPLAKLGKRYHATPAGQAGPLLRRLEVFGRLQGWVVGSFQ